MDVAVTWIRLRSSSSPSPRAVTSALIASSQISSRASASVMSASVRVTRWWMPSPSTMISETRRQSTPFALRPTMASATRPTCSVVSSIQAWSSPEFVALVLLLLLLLLLISLMMFVRSFRVLHSVTLNVSGSLIQSAHVSVVTRSAMIVLYLDSGIRQTRFSRIRSSGSSVASARYRPVTVIVTVGSQWLFSFDCAQVRSSSCVL